MSRRLRVAQLAPPFESVPPSLYGGTERVIAWLVDQLVLQGHEVTLFASGDSRTLGRLVPTCETALRLSEERCDPGAVQAIQLDLLAERIEEFDIVHNHMDYVPFALARRLSVPFVTTMHGRLDLTELRAVFARFRDHPVVSISDAQRTPLPDAAWVGTVHHGLPADAYTPRVGRGGEHLVFLGRVSPEKRLDLAIDAAIAADVPLKVAAKVDTADRAYFDACIRHRLDHPLVEFLGEVGEADKQELLAPALALLFPIDWPEPFGLVMIEAMACGTPVITRPCGSVPEVVQPGVSGFVGSTVDELVDGIRRAEALDRRAVRDAFEARFTVARMAAEYVDVYGREMARSALGRPSGPPLAPEVADA